MRSDSQDTQLDQITGCLIGGAIGDCMGAAVEGRTQLAPQDLVGAWQWTDDTQLTLATCEAVAESGISPEAIARAFVRWFAAGELTGLGSSTLKALRDLRAGAHWALAGCKGEMAAGNGAAMRVAALAFVLDLDDPAHRRTLRDITRITHHHDEAYVGALAIVLAIQAGRRDLDHPLSLGALVEQLPDTAVRDRLAELAALDGETPVSEVAARFGCSGHVVESVPLALFAASRLGARPFQAILEELILAGGDTDTNGSLFGQVAGARLGVSGLDAELVRRVPGVERLREAARRLTLRDGAG